MLLTSWRSDTEGRGREEQDQVERSEDDMYPSQSCCLLTTSSNEALHSNKPFNRKSLLQCPLIS